MKKKLSTFGYILEHLDIQAVSMARALHVDASLISKWKNGDRVLSSKSVYFDDVIDFLLQKSTETMHETLKDALLSLYPNIVFENETQIEQYLRHSLCNKKHFPTPNHSSLITNNTNALSTLLFEKNSGRRESVAKLLHVAEAMDTCGELLFIDNEEFQWLVEDAEYAIHFSKRLENLLHKGFQVIFVLHYSVKHADFSNFFHLCSSLIFHRNTTWYCNSYYDDTILRFSIATLNDAISLLGFSSDLTTSSTMVFDDQSVVLTHKAIAQQIIDHANPLFRTYTINNSIKLLKELSVYGQSGTVYSCLPSPVFLLCKESLLREILLDNNIPSETIEKCVTLNKSIRKFASGYFTSGHRNYNQPFILIFRLEDFLNRMKQEHLRSRSLTLACGTKVYIKKCFFAKQLRNYADSLLNYPNLHVVFVSNKDNAILPSVNCWCKENAWIVQMNKNGFRMSQEYQVVSSATVKWESCIRSIPIERTDNTCVRNLLCDLADRLDQI